MFKRSLQGLEFIGPVAYFCSSRTCSTYGPLVRPNKLYMQYYALSKCSGVDGMFRCWWDVQVLMGYLGAVTMFGCLSNVLWLMQCSDVYAIFWCWCNGLVLIQCSGVDGVSKWAKTAKRRIVKNLLFWSGFLPKNLGRLSLVKSN